MAQILLLLGVCSFQLLSYGVIHDVDAASTKCTKKDFGLAIFPCDAKNRTRSYMFFMKRRCNPVAKDAYFPTPQHSIPCDCPAGQGLSLTAEGTVVCRECTAGDYSVGGELIDNWRFWNSSRGIPGSDYRITVYCADIVAGSHCHSWRPGGNNKYLVSGPFQNSTAFLNCLQQKSMVMYRTFVNEGFDNMISFRYKVDGGPCPRNAKRCANGLHFYVDEKLVLHKDVQFRWKVFSMKVSKGTHAFRWIYQSSCKKSLTPSLDVAYIEHLALVGTVDPNTRCRQCPRGTYSKVNGSSECVKCAPGTYQNHTGQTVCLTCPTNFFSRIGDNRCTALPMCSASDYVSIPAAVNKCFVKDNFYFRHQKKELPQWPGIKGDACYYDGKKKPPISTTKCACQPGYFLGEENGKVICKKCPAGKYSYGNTTLCQLCPGGHAAIPGLYVHEWPEDSLPHKIVVNCSGAYCDKGWTPAGASIRTERIEGNFETHIEIRDVKIVYFRSKISFQCAVDCRLNPGQPALAKPSNCFMRFIAKRGNVTVHARDCVRYGGDRYRNGTVMNHSLSLKEKGAYTFRWIFHHGDERDTSLYSYEGRVYKIEVEGVDNGSAKSCEACPPGTYVSPSGSLCVMCPKGTFSAGGGTKCTPCPDGYFSDKTGSSKCTKCGTNTKSNKTRDGCDFNNCRFSPQEGITYDLSPLGNDGGPMTKVMTRKVTGAWFKVYYYVNPCFVDHDNSSCIWRGRLLGRDGKNKGYGTTILRTMACRRWAFDPSHSFSLGHVLGYIPNKVNPGAGLTLELTDGYQCYNRHSHKTVKASTHIDMICDPRAGRGVPSQVNNGTDVEKTACYFHMLWRSVYACPLCHDDDYEIVHTDCVNGFMNETTATKRPCRSKNPETFEKYKTIPCKIPRATKSSQKSPKTVLIVVIVFFTLVTLTSLVVILVLCRRNQSYRVQLFSSGKTLAQLQNKDASDFQELISDDTY